MIDNPFVHTVIPIKWKLYFGYDFTVLGITNGAPNRIYMLSVVFQPYAGCLNMYQKSLGFPYRNKYPLKSLEGLFTY